MCGLVGIISKNSTGFSKEDIKILKQLIEVDTLRGKDSTGLFYVNEHYNVYGIKDNVPGYDFINSKEYQAIEDDIYLDGIAVFAHNRFATLGATTNENAHPFVSEHLCLVHNGTIHNFRQFDNTCSVDSQAITKAFAREGYAKIVPDIIGAYAFIWADTNEKKIFILRNEDRPLYVIETSSAYYIASESKMLSWIVGRNINLLQKDIPAYFECHHLYSVDLTNPREGLKIKELPKPEKKITQTTSTFTVTGNNTYKEKHSEYGKKILFKVTEIMDIFGKIILKGESINNPTIKIKVPNLTCFNENYELYNGEIIGTEMSKDGHKKYLLSNVYPVIPITTINNEIIYIHPNGHYTCVDCNTPITQEDSGKVWVRIKNGVSKTFRCPTCTEKHKHIK